MSPAPPASARSRGEPVDAVALDRVPVRHHDGRRAGRRDRARRRRTRRPCACRRPGPRSAAAWIDRPVHHRVAVRQADLDEVDAALDHRLDRGDRRLHGREARPAGSRPGRRGSRRACARRARRCALIPRLPRSSTTGPSSSPNHSAAVWTSLSPRPGEVDQDRRRPGPSSFGQLERPGQRVRGLDRRDDALGLAEQVERGHRLGVGGRARTSARPVVGEVARARGRHPG